MEVCHPNIKRYLMFYFLSTNIHTSFKVIYIHAIFSLLIYFTERGYGMDFTEIYEWCCYSN